MDLEGVEFRPNNVIRNQGDHRIDYILMNQAMYPEDIRGEVVHKARKE